MTFKSDAAIGGSGFKLNYTIQGKNGFLSSIQIVSVFPQVSIAIFICVFINVNSFFYLSIHPFFNSLVHLFVRSFLRSFVHLFVRSPTCSLIGNRFILVIHSLIGCSEDFFDDKGTFTSPNYPEDYPNNAYCLWRIRVSSGMKIQLTFQDFALEGHCHRDSVTVYNGYLLTSPEVGTYCSTQQPFTLESSSNEMTVLFKSSFNRVRKGFKASYKAIEGGCGGRLTGIEGSLTSPAYPANYPPISSCEWTIDVNSTQRVSMTISPLAFPGNDNNCRWKILLFCRLFIIGPWVDTSSIVKGV